MTTPRWRKEDLLPQEYFEVQAPKPAKIPFKDKLYFLFEMMVWWLVAMVLLFALGCILGAFLYGIVITFSFFSGS